MTVPLVIDTDPGIDDALALLLACTWRRCRVEAVTVTYGNTTLDIATRNAKLLLERARCLAPVYAGADRPLRRGLITAKETHGEHGLGDLDAPPAPRAEPSRTAIVQALRAIRGPVTLVTLGPLTNLAHAVREDLALLRAKVARHVMMGGNLDARGNTAEHSEFNVWCDPDAMAEVLAARLPTEMVGLDVTRLLVMPAEAVRRLAQHKDPEAQWFGKLLGFYVRFHQHQEGLEGAVINDPLAVALAVEPSLGSGELLPLRVDTSEGGQRGRTTPGESGDTPVRAYRRFDRTRVHQLLLDHLFGRWLTLRDFNP